VLELRELGFIILMILLVVSVIDFISTRLRLAVIGRQKIPG
jgi:phosphonate transport system permease protein